MPPPISSFPRCSVLSPSEAVYLAQLRRDIRLRSSRLLYILDGGRFYFLPRHSRHVRVIRRRASMARTARAKRKSLAALPREYRTLVRRRILSLRTALLNGTSMSTLSLRSSLSRAYLARVLGGGPSSARVPLFRAVAIADAAGVKVRTLAKYLRRVRAIRARALGIVNVV